MTKLRVDYRNFENGPKQILGHTTCRMYLCTKHNGQHMEQFLQSTNKHLLSMFWMCSWRVRVYMQSNKIHNVVLMSDFIQHLC